MDPWFEGIECCFHVASYGMSSSEMLEQERIQEINVQGTENVIQLCLKHKVKYLIYTSTVNVVFGGQPIQNGDESLAYFPLSKHTDHYSRSKSVAEQLVLKSNSKALATSAIRACAIYGAGEQRHFPRIISNIQYGLVFFRFGSPFALQDWIHVKDLAKAHRLAFESLKTNGKASGKAYFVSDGHPVSTFHIIDRLVVQCGKRPPKLQIPLEWMLHLGDFVEFIHTSLPLPFKPFLTRAEVLKTGQMHYFSIESAKRDLGFEPSIKLNQGLQEAIEDYRIRGYFKSSNLSLWIIFLIFVLLLHCGRLTA
ncbi:3-beta hydroxysteroid dehydrogenase/isomerase family-domain-containing protein [Gorgonomyces haynaldii]|nr:3-beta hydroxysteroid dehydrogenase/isomerase family-domain-containing protein [Gorgonomyces haynaldii]